MLSLCSCALLCLDPPGVDLTSAAPGEDDDDAAAEPESDEEEGSEDDEEEESLDNKDFDDPRWKQVAAQKALRWSSIAREELVWYGSYPALVVPPRLYQFVPSSVRIPGADGVVAYGPNQSSEQEAAATKREKDGSRERREGGVL